MNDDIKLLKQELALLKLNFNDKIETIERRINQLNEQILQAENHSDREVLASENELLQTKTAAIDNTTIAQTISTPISAASAENPECPRQNSSPNSHEHELESYSPEEHDYSSDEDVTYQSSPSFIGLFFRSFLSVFFEWLTPVLNIYQSYKDRGMVGIFALTVLGIALTLAGFGYLMQLLIDQLNVGLKSLLMGLLSISVIGLGIYLKIKTRFSEFSTAIVTLGILLSYSTVYFAGSVYGILPNLVVLLLYLVIAVSCHGLALLLDTKIVAALGIIGISTMPILSNTLNIEPLSYVLSLTFVICSSLVLSYRYQWLWLGQLSLAFTVVALEWVIAFESAYISPAINVLYMIYFIYAVAFIIKYDSKSLLLFIAALVGSTVLILFQTASINSTYISISFLVNNLVAILVSVYLYKIKRELTAIFILIATIWAVLAVVSLLGQSYWSIAWAVEGLLLLYIGKKVNLATTVKQGQILTTVALLYLAVTLAAYFPLPALQSVTGWTLSLIALAIVAIWQRLIDNSQVFSKISVEVIKPILCLIEALWFSVLLICSSDIWLGNWTGALVIILQAALLFRAKYCQNKMIDVLAALLFFVALYYVIVGGFIVHSMRFTHLPLFAQLALISAFLQLWLWAQFYRKYQPEHSLTKVAEAVRIFFYLLLPICWLTSVFRHFEFNAIMILWLSPLIALQLVSVVKHQLLMIETKILTVLASVTVVVFIRELSLLNGLVALLGFAIFYYVSFKNNIIFQHNKSENAENFHKIKVGELADFILYCAIITTGFAVPHFIAMLTSSIFFGLLSASIFFGLLSASIYWALLFNVATQSHYLTNKEKLITIINLVIIMMSWFIIPINGYYIVIPIIFIASCLYQKPQRYFNSVLAKYLKQNSDLLLHTIFAISYLVWLNTVHYGDYVLFVAPILAVHGALVLFLKDKRVTTIKYGFTLISLAILKLALIDAANALLWQKVILFMGIGVFILIASFWYQKLLKQV